MRIRLATNADLSALQHLHGERMALLVQGDRRIKSDAVQWFDRDSGKVWVGEADGAVAGYVSARRTPEGWRIDHMALDAHTYHPGMARALVGAVREAARGDGAAHILVRVPSFHPVEQAFWRALGAARIDDFAPPGYQWMQVTT